MSTEQHKWATRRQIWRILKGIASSLGAGPLLLLLVPDGCEQFLQSDATTKIVQS